MANKIEKITLFTASACPLGRTMKHVLQEVVQIHSDWSFSVVFIDVEPELTNKAKITVNPTTLAYNCEGEEICRIEGFKETEEVLELIKTPIVNETAPREKEVRNVENDVEQYTVYLLNDENDVVPVELEYVNPIRVKTPRLTAIKLLLQTRHNVYTNPFPDLMSLKLVEFEKNAARVYVHHQDNTFSEDLIGKMEKCLLQTLRRYGIEQLHLVIEKT